MWAAHVRLWSKLTPRNFTVFSKLIVRSLIFRMKSAGMCLLRVNRMATVLLTEILKPHSPKNVAVSVGYRWTSLDKAGRFGPDIELSSANCASLRPFDDSGSWLIMMTNSSGLGTLPSVVPLSRKYVLDMAATTRTWIELSFRKSSTNLSTLPWRPSCYVF